MSEQEALELLKNYAQLQAEHEMLKQEMTQLKRMIFGSKSERFITPNPDQLSLDMPQDGDEPQAEQEKTKHIAAHARREQVDKKKIQPVRGGFPDHLPREVTIIKPEGDLIGYTKMGEERTEYLEMIAAKFFVKVLVREKYVNTTGTDIRIAELPTRAIDKGILGEHLIAGILTDKYVDHLPLYRQIERFKRDGVLMSASTLNDTVKNICRLLEPLYALMRSKVLASDYLQVDETPIKVLDAQVKGKTHRGYHWVYHAVKEGLVLFDYQEGRGREGPANLLKDFKGYLQTDGYGVYEQFEKNAHITLLGCMAHARRKFEQAKENDINLAENALVLIQRLYIIEKTIRETVTITENQIHQLRQELSIPALHDFEGWLKLHLTDTLPKSAIGQAIQYTLPRIEKLKRYTEQPWLQIDNNLVENAIRPIAIGRKNYLFAGSHEGATRAAMIYSFVGTCKLHNVNPQDWLADIMVKIKDTKMSNLESLLPLNWKFDR